MKASLEDDAGKGCVNPTRQYADHNVPCQYICETQTQQANKTSQYLMALKEQVKSY